MYWGCGLSLTHLNSGQISSSSTSFRGCGLEKIVFRESEGLDLVEVYAVFLFLVGP